VFFEVLLASSYGLMLHGSGPSRVKAGLHYIAVNLVASFLFLIGVSVIYGMTGTLNMADLAIRIPMLDLDDRALFEAGAAILGVAFFVKAGIWPLNFWLPPTYAAASAPVGAVFALMTKVGVYAVVRVGTLLASADVQTSFIDVGLFYGGAATVAFGVIGMLAAQHLGRLVAYSVIASSGLLLMALGLRNEALTAPILFYLSSSVLATAAFFMLNGLTERMRLTPMSDAADVSPLPDVTYVGFGVKEPPDPHSPSDEVGIAIPAAMAFLGLAFVCCVLLVAGLPPLSGFVAKFALLHAIVNPAPDAPTTWHSWLLVAAVVVVYGRCVMHVRVLTQVRRMPVLVAFLLVSSVIWVAENVATFAGAWLYPAQAAGWHLVSPHKLVAWFLLMLISVVLVAWVHVPRPPDEQARDVGRQVPDRRERRTDHSTATTPATSTANSAPTTNVAGPPLRGPGSIVGSADGVDSGVG